MKQLIASKGKVWAYRDSEYKEIVLGSVLYLGKEDNGIGYYEIDKPVEETILSSAVDCDENI